MIFRGFKKSCFFIFCALFMLAGGAWAEGDGSLVLSLSDALAMAKERHVDLIIADERVQQAVSREGQAFGQFLPQLTADISQERLTRNLEAAGIPLPGSAEPVVGPFNSFDARLKLTQMIFDLGAIERLFSVRAGKKLSQAQYRKAEEDAMALVASLYLEAWRSREKIKFAQALAAKDLKQLRIAHRRFRMGRGTALQVKEAKASFKLSVSSLEGALAGAKEKELDLKAALGIPLHQTLLFDRGENLSHYGIPSEAEIEEIVATHPDIEAAKKLLKQRQAEQKIPLADTLPKFSVFADYGLSGEEPNESSEIYGFGIQGSVPIFEGGQRYFKYEENKSRSRESEAALEDTERHVRAKAIATARHLKQAAGFLRAKDSGWLVAKENYKLAESRFKNGSGSEWELVEAAVQNEFLKDQRNEAIATYLLANVGFAHALGRMEELIKGDGKK